MKGLRWGAMAGTVIAATAVVVLSAVPSVKSIVSGDQVLTEVGDGELVIARGAELQFRHLNPAGEQAGVQGVGGYTRPPTLNEAHAFDVVRGGEELSLVAGPVHGNANRVLIETDDGPQVSAHLVESHGLRWFWAELPRLERLPYVVAYDVDGERLDETIAPHENDGS